MKASSIHLFSRDSLQGFANAREDVNWRGLHRQIARKVYQDHKLKECRIKAFVVDDCVKIRRGKKMGGVSCHFDHLTGRTVKGQQVLALGLATESTFLPLDQDIFIRKKQIQPQAFKDNRSMAARRDRQARDMTKPALLALSVKRAIHQGFEADSFLADAWFGNPSTLRLSEQCRLTAILRMKKDKTTYRLTTFRDTVMHKQMLTATELFQNVVRKQWETIPGTSYQAKTLKVEINLAKKKAGPDQWITVRMQSVRGADTHDKPQAGKHDWALFLCTDPELSPQKILEIYALRWGIEVYFKESKQNLGRLKEQTITFTSHIASIRLTAIRYLMLLYVALERDGQLSEVRNDMSGGFTAPELWAKALGAVPLSDQWHNGAVPDRTGRHG